VKGSITVQEAADEEKDHESTTDLQIHSHSTRTLVGGELCAATDGIYNMLWEIAQKSTAGKALCDPMVAGWQTFKLAAAVGCPSVLFVCLTSPVCYTDQTKKISYIFESLVFSQNCYSYLVVVVGFKRFYCIYADMSCRCKVCANCPVMVSWMESHSKGI
jgi:hypothetical protein